MTHTPGPWHVDSTKGHNEYQVRNTKRRICALNWDDSEQSLDDARLIAAAPALLEALEWAIERIDEPYLKTVGYADARAAIAQAKGGQNV